MIEDSPGFRVHVLDRDWLNGENFELTCTRPENFSFLAGQHVSLGHGNLERDYTIVSAIEAEELRFLIRRMPGEGMSDRLAEILPGASLSLGRATGYLTFRPEILMASLATLAGWIAEGSLRPHIDAVLPLDQVEAALEMLRARRSTGKIVIRLDDGTAP